MIKILVPEIAKEVGTTAALLLQHINYWMITQEKDKIFRTNNELVKDLNEMFSLFQIQYAKKKLVTNGYLVVSYDKKYDRTSHYTFTQKALDLLKAHTDYLKKKNESKTSRKIALAVPSWPVHSEDGTTVPEDFSMKVQDGYTDWKQPKQQTSKGMAKCFEEEGKKRDNVKKEVPDCLKHLVKQKPEAKPKIELTPINEDDILSPEYGDIMNVFSRVPNVDTLEKQRVMKEQMINFKEDY